MNTKLNAIVALLFITFITVGFTSTHLNDLLKTYPEVPRDIYNNQNPEAEELKTKLEARYKNHLAGLQAEINANNAKMILTFVTPEVGNAITIQNRENSIFYKNICKELGIDFHDLSNDLVQAQEAGIKLTQMPKDGHWSKEGAKVVADLMSDILSEYEVAMKATHCDETTPSTTYGDLEPSKDQILDGGKNLPYRVKSNKQGLRMDYDLGVKNKARVAILGDSEMYFPFLDNKYTGTALLQENFPEYEILNAGMWGYSIDDYVSLYTEKMQFADPDLVIVATNGNDVLDLYFSHRNKFNRNEKPHYPSEIEKAYYEAKY